MFLDFGCSILPLFISYDRSATIMAQIEKLNQDALRQKSFVIRFLEDKWSLLGELSLRGLREETHVIADKMRLQHPVIWPPFFATVIYHISETAKMNLQNEKHLIK